MTITKTAPAFKSSETKKHEKSRKMGPVMKPIIQKRFCKLSALETLIYVQYSIIIWKMLSIIFIDIHHIGNSGRF